MRNGVRCMLLRGPDEWADMAEDYCRRVFGAVEAYSGDWGDPLPDGATWWRGDVLLSLNARWIVPQEMLKRAGLALNFHPGPPEYPGVGCANWALYDGAERYGVTCHVIAPVVDSGEIVDVRRFPLLSTDTVASLLERTRVYQMAQFYAVVGLVATEGMVKGAGEVWSGNRRTRKDLDALMAIDPGMAREEMEQRIRATAYGTWRPYVELHGVRFEAGL